MMEREMETVTCGEISLTFDPAIPVMDALRKWWLAALAALMAGVSAFFYTDSTHVPRYTAACTLAVYEQAEGAPSNGLAKAFAEVVSSPVVSGIEGLQPERFGGAIRAQVLERSNLVTVSVTSGDPQGSMDALALLLAEQEVLTGPVTGGLALEILEAPAAGDQEDAPADPVGAFRKAALAGAVAVLGICLLLSWFRDTVRGPEEAARKLRCPWIGGVCRRQGLRQDAALEKLCRRVNMAVHTGGLVLVTDVRQDEGGQMLARMLREHPDCGVAVEYRPLTQALESLERADAVVLALRHNRTKAADVNRAAALMIQGGANLLGCVSVETWSTGLFDGEGQAAAWYRRRGREEV